MVQTTNILTSLIFVDLNEIFQCITTVWHLRLHIDLRYIQECKN